MRKILFAAALLVCSGSIYAQESATDAAPTNKDTKMKDRGACPKVYIGLSTGVNNNNGLLGFDFDVPVGKLVSVSAGAGASAWGSKIFAEGKYYLKPCQRGWAFAIGVTHNTGADNLKTKLETIHGKDDVKLTLKAQTNAFVSAYYYWTLGKHYNRFFLNAGWSVPLSHPSYHQVSGYELNATSKDAMRALEPGGPIAALGFSFGIRSKGH